MAKRKSTTKKAKQANHGQNGGIFSLTQELFQALRYIWLRVGIL
jgi:hypothetical protein